MKELVNHPLYDREQHLYFLDYEISGSWFASYVSWKWAQELVSDYLLWKTNKKYARYLMFKHAEETTV